MLPCADPNGANQNKVTALMLAVAEADEQAARLLIGAGADVHTVGKIGVGGISALHIAATISNIQVGSAICKMLLQSGACCSVQP